MVPPPSPAELANRAVRAMNAQRRREAKPIVKDVRIRVGDEFTIRGATYRVTHLNLGKGRFTATPVEGNVRATPGGPVCVEQEVATCSERS